MRTVYILCCLLLLHVKCIACDACGCGSGGSYIGIVPQFNNSFVGLRINERSFHSIGTPSIFSNSEAFSTQESFTSTDLWGKIALGKRWQIVAFVPYQYNQHQGSDRTAPLITQGLGDASLLTTFSVWNNRDSMFAKTKFNWQVALGLKAPTGPQVKSSEDLSIAQQPGSGSWDYTMGSILTVRRYVWGFHADAWYRKNGTGRNEYRFGDRFNASVKAFYWKNRMRYTFLPNTGLYFEHNQAEVKNNIIQGYSGGYGLFAIAGIENYYRNLSIGLSCMQPITQNYSQHLVTANTRFMLSMTWSFGSKN